MKSYVLIIIASVFSSIATIFLKYLKLKSFLFKGDLVLFIAIILFFINFLLYKFALKDIPAFVAYAILSVSNLVFLIGYELFNSTIKLSPINILGIIILLVGLVMATNSVETI